MNDKQKDLFKYRKSIADNVDKIISYGKSISKSKMTGQLSLFGSETIEIEKVDIIQKDISDREAKEIAEKESDVMGVFLTYNPYSDHILTEKTICDTTLKEAFFCEENGKKMTFLASVSGFEYMVSQYGNQYLKVFLSRDGIVMKTYLTGEYFKKNKHKVIRDEIFVVRCIYNDGFYSLVKLEECSKLDVSEYVESISIIPNLSKIKAIRNYIWMKMRNKSNISLEYIIEDNKFPVDYPIGVTTENCSDLMNNGCQIFINKKI